MWYFKASKRRLALVLVFLFFVAMTMPAWTAYKVILKDGTVMEAKSKPISMEGNYRFTGTDNQFYVLPVEQVDQDATKTANASNQASQKPKVITNEDMPSSPRESRTTADTAEPITAEEKTGPYESAAESRENSAKPREVYWRGEARKIRAQIEEVDRQIATVKETIQKLGSSVQSCPAGDPYCYIADRTDEIEKLESLKKSLEKDFAALEEEGRKAGAEPGWFRSQAGAVITIERSTRPRGDGGGESSANNNEEYWRGEVRKILVKIEQADQQIATLKEIIKERGASDVNCPEGNSPQQPCVMIDRLGELMAREAEKKKLEEELGALEERGRKAGAQPGWFR